MSVIVAAGFKRVGKHGDPIYGYTCPSMWQMYSRRYRADVVVRNAPDIKYGQWLGKMELVLAKPVRTTNGGVVIADFVHLARGQMQKYVHAFTGRKGIFFVADEEYGDPSLWTTMRRDWCSSSIMNTFDSNKTYLPTQQSKLESAGYVRCS